MPTRAACAGREVPAPAPHRRWEAARPCSPATYSHPIVPRTHWTPSPCGRLSRPPRWVATPTTTTGPPPRPDGHSGRCACPEPAKASPAGTAGALPTFTHMPVGRVGAQLYPGGIAARYRNTPRGLARPISNRADGPERKPGPSAPTAHSRQFRGCCPVSGLPPLIRSPYAFLPCYRTRPAGGGPLLDRQGLLPPSAAPPASGCPSASPDRYGGRGQGLSPHPVIWRLVAQC